MTSSSRPADLSHFLKSRRAQLDPAAHGLPDDKRRVPGLKREELAALAGISRDYYVRLEQGRGHQMSSQVIESLARALQLDEDEWAYFQRLASPSLGATDVSHEPKPVGQAVLALLDQWSEVPAYVFDSNQDIIAINEMADLVSPAFAWYGDNLAVAAFEVVKQFPNDEAFVENARRTTAALRFHGDPGNARLSEIVGLLSVEHHLFRRLWAEHHAHPFVNGTVPVSIDGSELVEFPWQILEVPGGFFMTFMPVAAGSRPERMLAGLRESRLVGRAVRGPLVGWPAVK